jgi:hypothetical protein
VSRSAVSAYIPPEHGAWAMLLVPFLLGTFSATPSWWSLLLLVAWLAAYLTTYFAVRWLKTRRLRHRGVRFRTPMIGYAAVLTTTGAALVIAEPWLLAAALAFVPFELVAVVLALKGRERCWVAGVASATAASLMAPVSYRVADGDDRQLALLLFTVSWLSLAGVVLHVKSTIRERDDRRFRWASIAFHLVALGLAIWIEPWMALPFGYLLLRAIFVPQHGWRPARIGAVEIVGSVLVLVTTLIAL